MSDTPRKPKPPPGAWVGGYFVVSLNIRPPDTKLVWDAAQGRHVWENDPGEWDWKALLGPLADRVEVNRSVHIFAD